MVERVVATLAALLLVAAVPLTDEIGFVLTLAFFAWHAWQVRRMPAVA
jgi:predicted MarR family transcription regulator